MLCLMGPDECYIPFAARVRLDIPEIVVLCVKLHL